MASNSTTMSCDTEVYEKGVSVGLYDMPKEEAEAMCKQLTRQTGYLHDWHYFGGRVHVKALKPEKEPERKEGLWS